MAEAEPRFTAFRWPGKVSVHEPGREEEDDYRTRVRNHRPTAMDFSVPHARPRQPSSGNIEWRSSAKDDEGRVELREVSSSHDLLAKVAAIPSRTATAPGASSNERVGSFDRTEGQWKTWVPELERIVRPAGQIGRIDLRLKPSRDRAIFSCVNSSIKSGGDPWRETSRITTLRSNDGLSAGRIVGGSGL